MVAVSLKNKAEKGYKEINLARYRARSLPVNGALLKEEDRGETQLSLLDIGSAE